MLLYSYFSQKMRTFIFFLGYFITLLFVLSSSLCEDSLLYKFSNNYQFTTISLSQLIYIGISTHCTFKVNPINLLPGSNPVTNQGQGADAVSPAGVSFQHDHPSNVRGQYDEFLGRFSGWEWWVVEFSISGSVNENKRKI